MTGEIHGELSPESLRKIIAMAKAAPRVVKSSVYKSIRLAAEPAAQAARDEVLGPPGPKLSQGRTWTGRRRAITNTRSYHSGLRAGIAAGVKVGLGSGAMTMGVRITSSNKNLRADQYRMNRTYDKPVFRHPVFGGPGQATQSGKEWFYEPIEKTRPVFERGVKEAMDEAAEVLGNI